MVFVCLLALQFSPKHHDNRFFTDIHSLLCMTDKTVSFGFVSSIDSQNGLKFI